MDSIYLAGGQHFGKLNHTFSLIFFILLFLLLQMADDFRYLFPCVDSELFSKWDQFCQHMILEYEKVTDEEYRQNFNILKRENLPLGKSI